MQAIAKNDIKTGTVVDLTHEGHGVVKIDRFPIFIPQALINEQIEYKIIKVKKNFAIGKLLNINTRSENRVAPPCIYIMNVVVGANFNTYHTKHNLK